MARPRRDGLADLRWEHPTSILGAADLPVGTSYPLLMSAWPDIIEHMFDDNVEWVPKNLKLIPPGAVLAAMLDDISLEGCDGHDRVRVLAAHERMKTHYQSRS